MTLPAERSSLEARPPVVVLVALSAAAFVAPLAVLLWLPARTLMRLGCLAHVCDASDRLDLRAALGALVFLGLSLGLLIRGVAVYWRTGRRRPVAGPLVSALTFGGLTRMWLGPAATDIPVLWHGWGLTAGLLPLVLLGMPSARRWTAAMTQGDGPHRLFWAGKNLRGWDTRLSESTLDHLERARVWMMVAIYACLMSLTLIPMFAENGLVAGFVEVAVIVAIVTAALVLQSRSTNRARDQIAREHGLAPGSCHAVLFADPKVFDLTLAYVTRTAHRTTEPGADPSTAGGPDPTDPAAQDRGI